MDTSGLLALANRSDELHLRAVEVHDALRRERAVRVFSDWILGEFLSAAASPPLRQVAARIVRRIRASSGSVVVAAAPNDIDDILDFYSQHQDKKWSFVDCAAMLICRQRGIQRVFTHDRHFVQAGYTALLR
ncbi:MAG: PIN domain-containing protein [bacterium]|nr:PIN domain-containing protein [bacterium]